jgi:hypothetical protein
MQLIEYFLWISIKNNDQKMNKIWSIVGLATLCLHPIFFLMLLPGSVVFYRNRIMFAYVAILSFLFVYRQLTNPLRFYTTVGENKHLFWNWNWCIIKNNGEYDTTISGIIFYTLYILITIGITAYTLPIYYPLLFSVVLYLLYVSKEPATVGSSWCWISNAIFMVILGKLLFLLPACEL